MAGTKTYLVERHSEVLQVTVPDDWKVTFGPVFTPTKGGYGGPDNCLRFYESKDKQRAIFTQVRGFRDLSIPVKKQVKKVQSKSESARDHKSEKQAVQQETELYWVDAVTDDMEKDILF
jgi:hypothetical protein